MIRSRLLPGRPGGFFAAMLSAAVLLLALAACDDPSTVGTDIIGAQGGSPRQADIPLEVDTVRYDAITGKNVLPQQARLLSGQTQDDPLGDVTALGYLDFTLNNGPSNIGNETVESVELRLEPAYLYGDSTRASTFALYDMTEEWNPAGAPADTSLADLVENVPITEFTLAPGDTLATVEMPTAWVQEHVDEFQSQDSVFTDTFHGFQIEHVDGNAVVGFGVSGSSMQSTYDLVPPDTTAPSATYRPTKILSTIRQPSPEQPEDRLVLQDGTGRALEFTFALPDSLAEASLNRASLIFETDSVLVEQPLTVSRPALQNTLLYVRPEDEDDFRPLGLRGVTVVLARNDEGSFQTDALVDVVQSILVGSSSFQRFQIRPSLQATIQTPFGNQSVPLTSLNSALIRTDAGHEPRLTLTYTPTQ